MTRQTKQDRTTPSTGGQALSRRWLDVRTRRLVLSLGLTCLSACNAWPQQFEAAPVHIPAPTINRALATVSGSDSLVLAGGCFWGVQGVFQHLKGVKGAISGYAGGDRETASYPLVSTGTTGHAESVQITYDPSVVTMGDLLRVYFSVVHNPTELNHQGPDDGTQYRSAIFYKNEEQKRIAENYISQLDKGKYFRDRIATQLTPLKSFFPAEPYHQDYATLHPESGYINHFDLPKIKHLQEFFPDLYRPNAVLVSAH